MTPDYCPQCGAEVPANSRACAECGSCEETGWSESAAPDRLGIPDSEFDYDEFVSREFGKKKERRRSWAGWWWVAVGLLAWFVYQWLT